MSSQDKEYTKDFNHQHNLIFLIEVCMFVVCEREDWCKRIKSSLKSTPGLLTDEMNICHLYPELLLIWVWGKASHLSRTTGMSGHAAFVFHLFSLSRVWWRCWHIVSSDQKKNANAALSNRTSIKYLSASGAQFFPLKTSLMAMSDV